VRTPRKIARLESLSPEDFLSEIANGTSLLVENAQTYLNSANALCLHAPGRTVAHLRSVAEEEAAKVLILLDAVRCPRTNQKLFSKQLKYFINHLARGVYAYYACTSPADFAEARTIVEAAIEKCYYDGGAGELEYRNAILADREETLYVDYVEDNGDYYWISPKQTDSFAASSHPEPSQVVELADALVRVGCGTTEGLRIIADIWHHVVISENLNWSEYVSYNIDALRRLDNAGLSEEAEEDHQRMVKDHWGFPLYSVDITLRLQ